MDEVYGSSVLKFSKNYIAISVNGNNHFKFRKRSEGKSLLTFRAVENVIEDIKKMLDENDFTSVLKDEKFRLTLDKEKISQNKGLFQNIVGKVKEGWVVQAE